MKTTPFLLILSALILVMSCENSSESDLIEQTDPTENISYNIHIRPIINANCVSCHANPAINGASGGYTRIIKLGNRLGDNAWL